MARKRMIDPSIWASNDFAELDPFAQLVWIGLFSNADDEGRGIAKSAYIKSILFPYSEDLKLIKQVDKALNEIAKYMSITFYKIDKNEFYELSNWKKWQKVEKMQQSKIPASNSPESVQIRCSAEQSENIRGVVGEQSGNIRGTVSPNKKRREIEEKRIEDKERETHAQESDMSGNIPTLQDVVEYAQSRKSSVDPQKFFDYFEAGGWVDSRGQKVKNWKQKFITWENKQTEKSYSSESQLMRSARRLLGGEL